MMRNATQSLTILLGELASEGCTVVLTTHNLGLGLAIGKRVVVLARGKIVHDARRANVDPETFVEEYRTLTV